MTAGRRFPPDIRVNSRGRNAGRTPEYPSPARVARTAAARAAGPVAGGPHREPRPAVTMILVVPSHCRPQRRPPNRGPWRADRGTTKPRRARTRAGYL